MGNALQTVQRYDKSPSSCRHIVNCYVQDLKQSLFNEHEEPFPLFTNISISIYDIIIGYVIHNDLFKWKNHPTLTFNNNRTSITNHSDNNKHIINAFGSYIVHCDDKENIGKTFKWTFNIHQCHVIGIGIIAVRNHVNEHKRAQSNAFYSHPYPINYAITNDGCTWTNGTKQVTDQNTQNEETETDKPKTPKTQKTLKTLKTPKKNENSTPWPLNGKNKTEKTTKKRSKTLRIWNDDLFVMTTTTVFRDLEEEKIWDIDQSVRDRFNAKYLYDLALKQDIKWRQWHHWIRGKIVTYLAENNRVISTPYSVPPPSQRRQLRSHIGYNNGNYSKGYDGLYWDKQIFESNGFDTDCMITMELRLWCNTLRFYDYRAQTCEYGCFKNVIVDESKRYCIAVCLLSNESIKSSITLTDFSVD